MLRAADHIQLRRLAAADLAAFQAYRKDPVVARYQDWAAKSDAQALGFLTHMETRAPLLVPGEWVQIAVADRDGALLGDMGLFLTPDERAAEVGITLARAAQGQGHAQTAVNLAADYLFEVTEIQRIWGIADLRNTASLRLLDRLGFVTDRTEVTDGVTERFSYRDRPD